MKHFIVALFHILIIAPFLLYVGFHRAATSSWIYTTLFYLGCLVIIYHGYLFASRFRSSNSWIYAIHFLFVGPLLLYIGYRRNDTPRMAYELLMMFAFAALGYHLYSLARMINVEPTDE
jgi:uncharacterized membrane protein